MTKSKKSKNGAHVAGAQSTGDSGALMAMSSSDFAVYLEEALTNASVKEKLQEVMTPILNVDKIADLVSSKLRVQITRLETLLKEKDVKIAHLTDRVKDLEGKIDDQEQYSRRTSVRIAGLEEDQDEVLDDKMRSVLSDIGCKDEMLNINRMHRVGKHVPGGRPRQIIVQFTNYSSKKKVIKSGKELRTKHPKVFINEDLTRLRSQLLYQARKLKKAGKITDTWSFDGKILVKDRQNKIKHIQKAEELSVY